MIGLHPASLSRQTTLQPAGAAALAARASHATVTRMSSVEAAHDPGYIDLDVAQRAGYFGPGEKQALHPRRYFRDGPARGF
jgi:hypothetical protein